MTATLGTLMSAAGRVELRRATITDLPALVGLLTDDPLGNAREGTVTGPDLRLYERAFRALDADPAHLLVVATAAGHVVGTLQLSVIPGLSRRGALRAQIEGVRLHRDLRDQGVGPAWSGGRSRRRGAEAAPWSNSPPTRPAATPTASMPGSASSPPTKA
jgi:hypothetical protein